MVLIQQRISKIRPPSHFKSPPRSIYDWLIFLEIIYDIKISKPQLLKNKITLYDPFILTSGFHELLHLVE
ncbi:hypothetical protein BpHYR1_004368 [Brachionus plicatilis]|uniref:Uncharacterized protein n=1 Tax=Brachionus plicatilis TaxID=10195 RepID=A0A3M7Q5N1_BRAPC|nr:hypothetical protein BpHYR1_004368 [Brachionus plicatilis]